MERKGQLIMHSTNGPQEAYRRVEFDARVEGADQRQLVSMCYEQLVGALSTAVHAQETGDNLLKSRSLTRALSAITALQLGISGDSEVANALRHFYEAGRQNILNCTLDFDAGALQRLRIDFTEINAAMQAV